MTASQIDYADRLAHACEQLAEGQPTDLHSCFGPDAATIERGRLDVALLVRLGVGDGVPAAGAARGSRDAGRRNRRITNLLADRYELHERLGRGGFSEVWLALDTHLTRLVALKTPRDDVPPTARRRIRDALLVDGRSLAQVCHPNIVQVHDVFEVDSRPYLNLEYVRGESLQGVLAHGAVSHVDGLRYIADVGEALAAVHDVGLVHRDVKPDNILWDSVRDEVRLTDFGLTVAAGIESLGAGTPLYMAPEAFEGVCTPAVDVYSLAATLFAVLTGGPPFVGETVDELRVLQLAGLERDDPRLAKVPASCRDLVCAGLASDATRRPELRTFVDQCRGELNRSLASPPTVFDTSAPRLEFGVQRCVTGKWQPVASATAALPARDVVPVPEYFVRTGDWLRLEVRADLAGYLVVFNIGPSGALHVLYPSAEATQWAPIAAHETLVIAELQVVPPSGCERVFAVWCRDSRALSLDELRDAEHAVLQGASAQHVATRDIVRLRRRLLELPRDAWAASSLELDHQEAE